tara:strand:- start:598 stop:1380 length:783 start_codon:yes stop_codon:yes gene_type:complete
MCAKNYLKTFISFSFFSSLLFGKANANIQLHNTYFKRCLNNLNQEKYELALKNCNKAIKAHSRWGNSFNNRGLVHLELGNFESAIADFKTAMKLSPAMVSAKNYGNLAYAYELLGNYQGAIENYSKAIEIRPNLGYVFHGRGWVNMEIENFEQALDDYKNAIKFYSKAELKNMGSGFWNNFGWIKENLKDYKGALNEYNTGIKKDPNDSLLYANRAHVKFELGDEKGACRDYKKSSKLGDRGNTEWLNSKEGKWCREMKI